MLSNKKQEQKPYAIVIGLDTMQGLHTARILASHKIPIIAFVRDPRHHASQTRVCEKILTVDTTGNELIAALRELGPSLPSRAVVFPCHDQCVALISENRDQLVDWYHVVMADADVMETMMVKQRFYALAEANDVPCPQTLLLESRADAEAEAAEEGGCDVVGVAGARGDLFAVEGHGQQFVGPQCSAGQSGHAKGGGCG